MLLQRLIEDKNIGYNYDYMGSSEYENGATYEGRLAIAKIFVGGTMAARRVNFQEKIGHMQCKPVEVLALGTTEMLDALGDPMKISVSKETFRTTSSNIVGWMHVPYCAIEDPNFKPLMLLRTEIEGYNAADRVQKFLKDPIAALKG